MKGIKILISVLLILIIFTSCGQNNEMKDGCYTAQAAEYNNGWKEFVTITVKNGSIVSAEYNAENASGFIKSWDNNYMQQMKNLKGTYPNEYTRNYAAQLLQNQSAEAPVVIAGATTSANSFYLLTEAVIERAKEGNSAIVTVDTTH